MTPITIQDMIRCAAQDETSPLLGAREPLLRIREDELLCDERLDSSPELSPHPRLPATMNHGSRLLAFEGRDAAPLCLRPPTNACRKRLRSEEREAESTGNSPRVSPKPPRKNEEWLAWINWEETPAP